MLKLFAIAALFGILPIIHAQVCGGKNLTKCDNGMLLKLTHSELYREFLINVPHFFTFSLEK
jgi:hypothetical protein